MPSLRAQGASFAYRDAVPLFTSLDLQLDSGWIALVGPNGAGKTTLLRLLAGDLAPTEGSVKRDGPAVLCPQRVEAITPEIESLASSLDGDAHRIRAQLHLEPEALSSWNTLSPGERKRWQIGAALAADPAVLLLDEPTNHLDSTARGWLINALRRFRGVGILVSHDRALLGALAERTLWLQNGTVRLWSLGYDAARAEREAESRQQLERLTRAQDDLRKRERQLAEARREHEAASAQRSTGKRMRNKYDSDARSLVSGGRVEFAQKSLGKRVGSTRLEAEKAEELASSIEIEKELGRSIFATWEPAPKERLFTLQAHEIRTGDSVLLRDLSLTVSRGDRIHVAGPNGAGKSTLLAALLEASQLPPERILHLPQELDTAAAEAELREVRSLSPEVKGRILSILAALGVDPGRLLASESPSPGEARKLRLARGLGERAWVLVLDEPTNHLDLPSIERLEAALRAWPGALVLVTHDDALASSCCTTRWQVGEGAVTVTS